MNKDYSDYVEVPIYLDVTCVCSECGATLKIFLADERRGTCEIKVQACQSCFDYAKETAYANGQKNQLEAME